MRAPQKSITQPHWSGLPSPLVSLVSALALFLSIVSYSSTARLAQPKVSGAPLVAGLVSSAGRIARLEVKQGDKTIAVTRPANGIWGLADRDGFPVRIEAVQKTIRTKRLVSNGLVLQERFLRMTKRV